MTLRNESGSGGAEAFHFLPSKSKWRNRAGCQSGLVTAISILCLLNLTSEEHSVKIDSESTVPCGAPVLLTTLWDSQPFKATLERFVNLKTICFEVHRPETALERQGGLRHTVSLDGHLKFRWAFDSIFVTSSTFMFKKFMHMAVHLLTERFVFMTMVLHPTTVWGAKEQKIRQIL